MALSKRRDIKRFSAAAFFAAATLNASPLYLAVLSEQTASDAAWLAVAETLAECHGSETLIKNQKFSSDCTWVGIFGWMSASVAVCDAKDPMCKVLFGKRVKGYGCLLWSERPTGKRRASDVKLPTFNSSRMELLRSVTAFYRRLELGRSERFLNPAQHGPVRHV